MSVVPYVAPWATDFHRYSTQHLAPSTVVGVSIVWVIPQGQWWRIISLAGSWSTSATVADRPPLLDMSTSTGATLYHALFPLSMQATCGATVIAAPGQTAYTNTSLQDNLFGAMAMPDLLWQTGTQILLFLSESKAGDAARKADCVALVEIYTEDYQPDGTPVLVPTPLIA